MSGTQRRGFASFIKPQTQPEPAPMPAPANTAAPAAVPESAAPSAPGIEAREGEGAENRAPNRTATGRVRNHTASRNLPGLTLRLSEPRWEQLKMMSIQERRPIQEILSEAVAQYMERRGLRW